MGIQTDSTPVESPKPTEGSAILGIYRHVASPTEYADMESDFLTGGKGYGDFKKRLFAAVWEYFAPMREKRASIASDPAELDRIMKQGAERAASIAFPVMDGLRKSIGLR